MSKGAGLLLILGMALPLSAQKQGPPKLLTFLSYTATTSIFVDTVLTYDAIWNYGCYEGNPFWRPLMKYPPIVVVMDGLISIGVTLLAERLWHMDNKVLAWAFVIGINVVQGYCLYRHWQLRKDGR